MTKEQIIEFVNSLTPAKREFLTLYMASEKEKFLSAKTRDKLESGNVVVCPHCNSASVVKYGSYNSKTRYKCKQCMKLFNKTTGWEMAHSRKGDVFQEYLEMILNSVTIRAAAAKLKVNDRTVYLWRKKIISTFSYLSKQQEN